MVIFNKSEGIIVKSMYNRGGFGEFQTKPAPDLNPTWVDKTSPIPAPNPIEPIPYLYGAGRGGEPEKPAPLASLISWVVL